MNGASPGEPPGTGVGVLDRSVALLDAVEGGAGTLADLVRTTGLPRATAHRLASALEVHGLLARDEAGRWVLGRRLIELGAAAGLGGGLLAILREVGRPVLERLRDSTGESAQLYLREGDRRVCVDAVESDRELRTIVPTGASLPLTAGSAGKVFLAWAEEPEVDRLLAHLAPLTPATPTADRLLRELEGTRRRGWAQSVGEREPGVASVSAPVFGPEGLPVAAVSVSGPIDRTGRAPGRRYAADVTAAARRLERALGPR